MEGCEDLETTSIQCWALSERFEDVVMILFELKLLILSTVDHVSTASLAKDILKTVVVDMMGSVTFHTYEIIRKQEDS